MRQSAAVLIAHARGNDQFGQFFADSFLPAKTKYALGSGIKFKDPTICAHGDDAIERGIENAAIQHFELIARESFAVLGRGFGFHHERAALRARLTSLTRSVQ